MGCTSSSRPRSFFLLDDALLDGAASGEGERRREERFWGAEGEGERDPPDEPFELPETLLCYCLSTSNTVCILTRQHSPEANWRETGIHQASRYLYDPTVQFCPLPKGY